ncbi:MULTISPECIES: AAA family ATPase [unclassified Methylobacterium]|uniref:AAA family ATPase n=1 Tax=unclassified Methylobacterium TaxID=2615210 RepID=UPI000CBD854E|nr:MULTISPECIES: AAA family ATPase [unclassified Methylobacterium]PIU06656.1 MAG: AAA family ATPase [Methylobacterium sp. CG09_land_8_20_14_0_10_71_15]GBU19663.1 hypothetical protein AwMethylo_38780 [Methylobacterium sp.]
MPPKKNLRRGLAVSAVRARSHAFTKPYDTKIQSVDGTPLPTNDELLCGAEFAGRHIHTDIEQYLAPLLFRYSPHKLPVRLKGALKLFASEPSLARLGDLQHECSKLLADYRRQGGFGSNSPLRDPKRPAVLQETARAIEALDVRLDLWAAAVGCRQAALRCAARSFRQWNSHFDPPFKDPLYYGAMLSMLEFLGAANVEFGGDFDTYIPETRHGQIKRSEDDAYQLAAAVSIVREGLGLDRKFDPIEAEPEVSEPLPERVVGMTADGDLALDFDISEDRAGIVHLPAPEASEPEAEAVVLPELPGLLVVGDMSHVKRPTGKLDLDPVKEIEPIAGRRLPLVPPPADLAAARAELVAEFPHAGRVVDRLLRPLASQDSVRLPHVLIWGPPGGGKTRLARRAGEVLGLMPGVLSMAGLNDPLPITGTARGWSSAGFGIAVREFLRTKIANPMIIVDEGDKIGTSKHNGNAADALINLLGVETSERYRDVYLQAEINASRINWVITANSLDTVPRALLDRCLVLRLDEPGPEHLRTLASAILREIRIERGQDEAWLPPLDGVEWTALEGAWRRGGSLRALRRLIEAVLDARDAGPLQ